jgi:hypothetical protein
VDVAETDMGMKDLITEALRRQLGMKKRGVRAIKPKKAGNNPNGKEMYPMAIYQRGESYYYDFVYKRRQAVETLENRFLAKTPVNFPTALFPFPSALPQRCE